MFMNHGPQHSQWLHQLLAVGGSWCQTLTNVLSFYHKTGSNVKTQSYLKNLKEKDKPWKTLEETREHKKERQRKRKSKKEEDR